MSKQFYTDKEMKNIKTTELPMSDIDEGLPDVPTLIADIAKVLEYISIDSMLELRDRNEVAYKLTANELIEKEMPNFHMRYYSLLQRLISGGDISYLLNMLTEIDEVNHGKKTLREAELKLGEELAEEFLYPKLSKKKLQKHKKKMKNMNS